MSTYSLLVSIRDATPPLLDALGEMFSQQTETSGELVLVVGQGKTQDQARVTALSGQYPRIRGVVRPVGESIEQSCNALLPTLGDWVGFLGWRDRLLPEALAEVSAAIAGAPQCVVAYTDEESRSVHGHISRRLNKEHLNAYRLRHQEYLQDLVVIQKAWLASAGGFDLQANTVPRHALYLRLLESRGPSAFCHVPQRLYQRFRDHRRPGGGLPKFDLQAGKQHLSRSRIAGQVRHRVGTMEIQYQHLRRPEVAVCVLLDDQLSHGTVQLHSLARHPRYPYQQVHALYLGAQAELREEYAGQCQELGYRMHALEGNEPAALNQLLSSLDVPLVALLKGMPINANWLDRLVDHHLLSPASGVMGARLITPTRLIQPGLLRYKYTGAPWDARGEHGVLLVPHQVSAVSPHGVLFDLRQFHDLGGLKEDLPCLYGMDYCLRVDLAGFSNVLVPTSQVKVAEQFIPAEEAALFEGYWPAWNCRFGLHLPSK